MRGNNRVFGYLFHHRCIPVISFLGETKVKEYHGLAAGTRLALVPNLGALVLHRTDPFGALARPDVGHPASPRNFPTLQHRSHACLSGFIFAMLRRAKRNIATRSDANIVLECTCHRVVVKNFLTESLN